MPKLTGLISWRHHALHLHRTKRCCFNIFPCQRVKEWQNFFAGMIAQTSKHALPRRISDVGRNNKFVIAYCNRQINYDFFFDFVWSRAALSPFASVTASSFAQKCMK